MLVMAIAVAVYATAKHPAQAWVAALVAGAVSTLLIVIELVVMASYAPARMIPDLAPAALTRAADLEQSRAELQDPYVLLFVIGALIALTLGIVSMLARTLTKVRGTDSDSLRANRTSRPDSNIAASNNTPRKAVNPTAIS
jgi:hypothetical protein